MTRIKSIVEKGTNSFRSIKNIKQNHCKKKGNLFFCKSVDKISKTETMLLRNTTFATAMKVAVLHKTAI